MRRLACAIVATGLIAAIENPHAQQPPRNTSSDEPRRPKVCLVLSGGGARGAAHIGVLKVLERLHVPIDCVAGTSMGSIVGAAYASGTSLADMESVISSLSTRQLFEELPPREERAVRLKIDDASNLAAFELGFRDGKILYPMGLVSGVQLETVLRKLSKVRGYHRFDDLPIPFRAVATDLATGKPVILAAGDLAGATRASMSVPGAIRPARLEGKMLVDGGLTDNLPIDVARAMGADVVIAVNLGTPLLKPEALTTVFSVTDQMVNILTEQNVQSSLATLRPTDVLVLPLLGDFSASDFDHLQRVVPLGEAAATLVADKLKALALPEAQYDEWSARRTAGAVPPIEPIDAVEFAPMAHVDAGQARRLVQTRPGQPIDVDTLDHDILRLYGTGDFEHVDYQIMEEPGRRVLSVDAVEKSWGPDYLRFGLGLASDFRGNAFFNLLSSSRVTWLNRLGAEWRTDLQLGHTNSVSTELYQPLEASQTFFVAPSARYERRILDVYDRDQRLAQYDIDTISAGFDFGAQFTRYGEIRLGVVRSDYRTTLATGATTELPSGTRTGYTALQFRGVVDQLDSVDFPRAGYAAKFNVIDSRTAWGSAATFSRGDATGNYVASFGENTFALGLKLGGRIGSNSLPTSQLLEWGGLLRQSGYPNGALLGQELEFARLMYYQRLTRFTLLDGVYAGVSLEAGHLGRPLVPGNGSGALRSMALFTGVDTPLGPFYVGYGRASTGFGSWYLFLGRP